MFVEQGLQCLLNSGSTLLVLVVKCRPCCLHYWSVCGTFLCSFLRHCFRHQPPNLTGAKLDEETACVAKTRCSHHDIIPQMPIFPVLKRPFKYITRIFCSGSRFQGAAFARKQWGVQFRYVGWWLLKIGLVFAPARWV
jgi:hypothetical protein